MLKGIFQSTTILVCFLVSASYAQLPKASDFLPLKVGNIWQHQHSLGYSAVIQSEVVSDSLIGDTLVVYKLRFKAFQDPPIPDWFRYRYYNRDSTVIYDHEKFPQNPYSGFPMIDTRNGLEGRWFWFFGDVPGTLAITDTGSVSFFGQTRKWAEVNTIIEEGDTIRIDATYHARHVAGIGLTKIGIDTLIYARIDGIEFGTPVSVKEVAPSKSIPQNFSIAVYPNPARRQTTLYLNELPEDGVEVTIYNALGQKVRSFNLSGVRQRSLKINWDGRDIHNKAVPVGVYFLQVRSRKVIKSHKFTFFP